VGGDAAGPRAEDRPPAPGLHRPRPPRLRADGGPRLTRRPPARVLLLLPTNTYRARDFLEAAERLGVETVVGSDRRQALEDVAPGRTLALDLRHPAAAAGQIARFAERRPLRAVIPTDDDSAVVAAAAAARLGLPHNPPQAALAAARKDVMRDLLRAAAVPSPAHRLLPADADPERAATQAAADPGYPCVLKPTFLAASRGVIRADDPARFVAAFRRLAALLASPDVAARDPGAARHVLVEAYVPGPEVALEGLLVAGRLQTLALFDKPDPLEGPFFEETIYVTPSRHPRPVQTAIAATVAAAARALGLRHGPVHAELRLAPPGTAVPGATPRGPGAAPVPVVIEVAARSIGGLCSRTLRFGTGLSLEEILLMHALGRDVRRLRRETPPAGVMMIPIPRVGVLRRVRGLDAARAVPGIVEATITATLGKPLVPLPEGNAYLGFLFARAGAPAASPPAASPPAAPPSADARAAVARAGRFGLRPARRGARGRGAAAVPSPPRTPAGVEAALRAAHRRLEFVIEPER
jgi:biotin carboxylase